LRQREKTMSERMHEADNIERIIAEENRRKMLAGVTEDGAGGRGHKKNPAPTLAQGLGDDGKTRSQVAEAVGMKRSTHRKVKDVYDTAKDDTLAAPRISRSAACGAQVCGRGWAESHAHRGEE
jgi:hypothetical protein